MLETAPGLVRGAALHGEHDIARSLLADNLDDPRPIYYASTAGATHRRAGYLAALSVGVLHGNVLRMQVYQPFSHAFQPLVHIVAGQVGVSGVEADTDGRLVNKIVKPIQTVRRPRVLCVGFQTD